MVDDTRARAAAHWNRVTETGPVKKNWWQHPSIWKHINSLVGAEEQSSQPHASFHARIRSQGPFDNAVSVGCGTGAKEMNLVLAGVVRHFDLFEIADARVALGQEFAERQGISECITWRRGDAFQAVDNYDLVYWNNSLHHMTDVDEAVRWSRDRIARRQGVFAMDDYVGASRFQWSDDELRIANRFRRSLPARLTQGLPIELQRPSIQSMINLDPSEAADSSNVLPTLRRHMPQAEIIATGGCLYHLGLNGIVGAFTDSEEDEALLNLTLQYDQALVASGFFHYAVAIDRV